MTSKIEIEEEKKLEAKKSEGRIGPEVSLLGGLARSRPDVMQQLDILASATRRKKVEIVSDAITQYFELSTLGGIWKVIATMTPEQLMASWQLFRYLMGLARQMYLDVAKEFIEGAVATYVELIEGARRSGYEQAKREVETSYKVRFERELEARHYSKIEKIMQKLDPLIDMLVDMITDRMIEIMGMKKKVPKFRVPVVVKEG